MSATNAFETSLLEHILQNANIANVGDATGLRGSSAAGNLYVSLHTSSPGEAGSQTTNEATYTSYARVAVARSGSGWTVSGNSGENTANITFPACTGGSNTVTYFGIGTDSSGAGTLLFYGLITSPGSGLAVSDGITPVFGAGDLVVTAD